MTSKVDQNSLSFSSAALQTVPYSVTLGESRNFDLTASSSHVVSSGSSSDPPFLFNQFRSVEWIERYGLKSQKLTFDQILQQIGFKRVESFDPAIGKTVTAKYAGNLYHEVQHDNGDRYVLTCRPEKLREYHQRLLRMLYFLRKRLTFITNGSRRLFGIISEPNVCLVCDCKTLDHRIFNQFQTALTSLLKEQITRIKKFNIIWVSNDNEQFREQIIDVNSSNIDQALDWICDRKCPRNKISISSTCEAVLKAFSFNVDSIYLISEGDSSDFAREMLRDNIVKTRLSSTNPPIPLHVVSLFCHNNDTQQFLRSIAQSADGNYFCYKIKNEISDLKAPSNLSEPTRIKLQDDKLQVGTNVSTPVQEYPVDIALMYKEIIECQNVIDRIERILGFIRDERQQPFEATKSLDAFNVSGANNFQRSVIVQSSALFNNDDYDLSSEEWLKTYGIDAQKLDFFSVLHTAAFRHCDGVVKLLKPPQDSQDVAESTPAIPQDKLVNAIYCDQFAHVSWPDGTVRHVHVTPELHRDYERRIRALLEKIRARLTWLRKGSREVFGAILENNIYFLIDTSKSMQHHLGFVKEKLRLLLQDQLNTKERLNFVAYNSILNPWRDRLTKISDSTTFTQLQPWINGLSAEGSTNTLAALRFALADPATEAIYLLSDGRPDQNERHILSQVQYRQSVPIHTIAFNCQDMTANQFLYDLAKQTGGRFHAFSYGFEKQPAIELPESEDVGLLKREFERGETELQRIATLRDECLGKAWAREHLQTKTSKFQNRQTTKNENSLQNELKSHSTIDMGIHSTGTMSQRINRKKRSTTSQMRKRRARSATHLPQSTGVINIDPNIWMLPETRNYLGQTTKHDQVMSDPETEHKKEVTQNEQKKIRTPYDEMKSFLKRNGLIARGLTIFDVLQPTSVNVKEPRHIQVIDRYVLAKVWDDILPLAYGSYVGKLRLVNHYAVDLEKYEIKLKELISEYHRFTTNFIWKHLSDDDKKHLGPSVHWNNLSTDERTKIENEIPKDEHTNKNALYNFAWRKLSEDQQNELIRKPVAYQDWSQELLKNALNDAGQESALKAVNRVDVEINRGVKFLQISTDLRQLQKRADNESKEKVEQTSKPKSKSAANRSSGQRVICRFDDDGFYYPGTIRKNPLGRHIIQFDMGIEQEAVGHVLLPTNGAIAQPHLFVNDYVLVRQMNDYNEYWVPGIVLVLPSSSSRPPPLHTVQIFTPSAYQIHVIRRDLLKISFGVFQQTILYIESIHHQPLAADDAKRTAQLEKETLDLKRIFRKEIEPLASKLEDLDKSHDKCFKKLNEKILDNKRAIEILKEKETKENRNDQPIQTEISLKAKPSPSNTPQSSTRSKSSSHPQPSIDSNLNHSKTSSTRTITPEELDSIKPGTNVFTIWKEYDSLVSKGEIRSKSSNSNRYVVQRIDVPKIESTILRDDIFLLDELRYIKNLKPKALVLLEYPKTIRGGWRPAVILSHSEDNKSTNVRFYDGIDMNIMNDEYAIEINSAQFERFTQQRIEFEKSFLKKTIVGLNDKRKLFMLGTVIKRIGSGYKYKIKWCDETESEQDEDNLFGDFYDKIMKPDVNDYVLALDKDQYIYSPAQVIKVHDDDDTLRIRYSVPKETNRKADVRMANTFLISEAYYNWIGGVLNK